MNYLKVPDSDIKLTDGSVVMLARFPGTKWVVRYGWYEYAGRRNMGWYFSSIPAQTVIPVTLQDLQFIVLLDGGESEQPELPPSNKPVDPAPGFMPGPPSPPWPPAPGTAPEGLFPVNPSVPGVGPVIPFTPNDKYLLDSSWITLPSIKYRDTLSTICKVPDGKIVKINNVDGATRYYSWSSSDQRWYEKFFENDTEQLLANYYNISEIDAKFAVVDGDINIIEATSSALSTRVDNMNDRVVTFDSDLDSEIAARTEAVAAEARSRIAADEAETASRIAADNNLTISIQSFMSDLQDLRDDTEHDITEETNARVAADNAEIQARIAAINAESLARQEADNAETTARRAADDELSSTVTALSNTVASYQASNEIRLTALEAADDDWNSRLDALEARIQALENGTT